MNFVVSNMVEVTRVCGQNSIVRSVYVDGWTDELAIIAYNAIGQMAN